MLTPSSGLSMPSAHAPGHRAEHAGVGIGRGLSSQSARNSPAAAATTAQSPMSSSVLVPGEQLGAVERPGEEGVEVGVVEAHHFQSTVIGSRIGELRR